MVLTRNDIVQATKRAGKIPVVGQPGAAGNLIQARGLERLGKPCIVSLRARHGLGLQPIVSPAGCWMLHLIAPSVQSM